MNNANTIAFVLHCHAPFVRHPELTNPSQELWLFQSISETYIPLLEVFDRLDRDLVPFRMGISLSPSLCQMLGDEYLMKRYLEYTDRQLAFGERELERSAENPELNALVRFFYERTAEKKELFSGPYENNIIKRFDYYQKKGRLEILATAATNAFLPFYADYPELIRAQFELSISSYRSAFGRLPQGFWLPELGWKEELDPWLRAYNFGYTIVDTHALVFARPFAERGSFYPAKTPQGVGILGRDFYSARDIKKAAEDPLFRNNKRDLGFELPPEDLSAFLGPAGIRTDTGYRYWSAGDGFGDAPLYNPRAARERAEYHAGAFLDAALSRLSSASELMDAPPLSLCAFDADDFGRFWHEGPLFIEALFREGKKSGCVQFMTPAEYYCKFDSSSFQQLRPEFSSWGPNGYAETWLDASNDWMYRHVMRALERMVEIVERFLDDTGLKERALNQAAREILLALDSSWAKMLYRQEHADYARSRIEDSLKNFTTIYESLGSNYISTEWLTRLERQHNIFPNLSYRIFGRKAPN